MPLALVVCEAQRCAVEVTIAGVHVRPEFDEQFDGVQLTGASGAMQRRFITRFAVHVNAQFHQQAKTVHTAGFGGPDEESSRIVQERRIARHEFTGAIRVVSVAGYGEFIRCTESDSDSLRSLCDKIVGNLRLTVIYGFRIGCSRRPDTGLWR